MNSHAGQRTFLKPWQASLTVHLGLVLAFVLLTLIPSRPERETYEVAIKFPQSEEPEEVQKIQEVKDKPKVVLKSVNHDQSAPAKENTREVFGMSRRSHTDNTSESADVSAKLGNNLAKETDNEKLQDSDADSLPVPTEEYLVSEMPTVINEVKPQYPKEAKEKQIEGAVTMNILIDEEGHVRQTSIVDGPEIFRSTALEAIKKFLFNPAKVDGKAVAVKIRYILRFELEY